ncbi:MAG: hypothetical protein Edafosvirus1_87 [Edafosvirus sp.]|uniref:Uncharacterized protein n=1 Tax=Edafosvirus sp. TaxID=2487765 RepID=A0A3G4ZS82_9VIRU|nr:MAG: hypothetical protein Edafosvirus1_87 [Edafosvirus sp.]
MHTAYFIKRYNIKTKKIKYTIYSEPTPTTTEDKYEYDILIDKVSANSFAEASEILYRKYQHDYPLDCEYVDEDIDRIENEQTDTICIIL